MKLLLDTHVLLWWLGDRARMSRKQRHALSRASAARPVHLCDISRWEVAGLYERGHIRLSLPLREWLENATAPPLVETIPLSAAIAAELVQLAATLDWDPADRILVATARVHGLTLATSDERIIDSGLVDVVA